MTSSSEVDSELDTKNHRGVATTRAARLDDVLKVGLDEGGAPVGPS